MEINNEADDQDFENLQEFTYFYFGRNLNNEELLKFQKLVRGKSSESEYKEIIREIIYGRSNW